MAKSSTSEQSPAQPANDGKTGVARTRSPNYPVYRIDSAIKKIESLATEYKRHRVPVDAAAKTLGFSSPKSSSGSQAIAALKAYGLIEVHGTGDKRQIAVSETGHKIIGNHSDRKSLIAKAALAPALHAELFKRFMTADGIAPDATIRQYLLFDRENGLFNDDVVDTFIRQFKGTLTFAGLTTSDKMSEVEDESNPPSVSVGDFVQWESQGVAQFPEPRRVTGKSEDGGYLFVEGTQTGLPVAEVLRVEPEKSQQMNQQQIPAQGAPQVPPMNPNFKPGSQAASKEDKYTGETGDFVVRWPAVVSADDLEDVEAWLDMLKRKIKRSVKEEEPN